jgi:ribonucleoside-diphosphate reductase alpha chain
LEKIVHNAWKSAEPGILFWDTIIGESVPDCYADLGFTTVSTNPCGEIPLCPYDSCRLLAINLFSYVKDPFTPSATFDMALFKKHVAMPRRSWTTSLTWSWKKLTSYLNKIQSDPEEE